MDRNQATGLILIALMVMLYFYFFAPKPQPVEEQTKGDSTLVERPTQPEKKIQPEGQQQTINTDDSLQNVQNQQQFGIFAKGASGLEEETVLENNFVKINLSSHGGKINRVELKNFKTFKQEPLILLDGLSNKFSLMLDSEGKSIDLNKLYYTPQVTSKGDTTLLTYSLNISANQSVKHIYKLTRDTYELEYRIEINGFDQNMTNGTLTYQWDDHIKAQEKDLSMSRKNSTINYYTKNDDFDDLSAASSSLEEETVEAPIKWITIKQRFFIAGIIAQNSFKNAEISTSVDESDSSTVKYAKVRLGLPYEDIKTGKGNYTYYFGPNDYHVLKGVTPEFESNLNLGWPPMKWINRFVIIPLFDLLSNFLSNYGIIIVIMVLLIKLVLSPLSYKSYLSMAKMKVLKPELDELKEKHGGDMAKAQQEQMKLYSKVGVSPLSGCIPMLLQMPILFAMFTFFPQSIELRGKSFLWAEDLSTYDSIAHLPFNIPFYGDHVSLFVLLMTMSTILYTWSNQQVSTVQGPMKSFSYMMPVVFMFVLNSYPAALSFYYFVSNLVTFGQQAVIRKFVDEDKIKTIMEENRKKSSTKKKSKFKLRLEEAMKASQQAKKKK